MYIHIRVYCERRRPADTGEADAMLPRRAGDGSAPGAEGGKSARQPNAARVTDIWKENNSSEHIDTDATRPAGKAHLTRHDDDYDNKDHETRINTHPPTQARSLTADWQTCVFARLLAPRPASCSNFRCVISPGSPRRSASSLTLTLQPQAPLDLPGRLSNSSMIFSRQKISASESATLNNDLAFRLPIQDSSKHVHKSHHAEG